MLAPNTLLNGRYRIEKLIGQGGMSVVYKARAEHLQLTVAVKEAMVAHRRLVAAFEKEAQRMARLRHPGLPRVIDHFTEGTSHYLVMEFIEGEELAERWQATGQPFSLDEVLALGDQLLAVLDYLHGQQPPIIHRDIKPQNLKVMPNGVLILLDFGLAKGGLTQQNTSGSKSLFGYTVGYAPPEQMKAQGTDQRSDLYSVAATLWTLLTAQQAIDAQVREQAAKHGVPDPMRPANELNPQVSPLVAQALTKALSLDPNQRPQSATEMRQLLQAGAKSAPSPSPAPATVVTTSGTTAAVTTSGTTTAGTSVVKTIRAVSGKQSVGLMSALLLILLVAILAYGLFRPFNASQSTTPTQAAEETATIEASPASPVSETATATPTEAAPAPVTASPPTSPTSCPTISPTLISEPLNYKNGKAIFPPFSNDYYLVGTADGIHVFSTSSEIRVNLYDTGSHNRDIAFSPNGELLVVVPFGSIERHTARIENNELLINKQGDNLPVPETWFSSISFSPDEQLFAFFGSNGIEIWNTVNWQPLTTVKEPTTVGTVFSPLLTGSEADYWFVSVDNETHYLCVWGVHDQVFDYQPEKRVEIGEVISAQAIKFSPDATKLAIGTSSGTIEFLDIANWQKEKQIYAHDDGILSISFSADGRLFASTSEDGTAKVWDPISGACLYTLEAHPERASSIDFSPDGKKLVSVAGLHAYVWEIEH